MLFLDTSALVKRYVDEDGTSLVLARMNEDREWAASAIARTEVEITLCRHGFRRAAKGEQWQRVRDDWERMHVVPMDPHCLERAAHIGCEREIRTLDAVHLAAADRLPRPLLVLTFDRRVADAARWLDFAVEGA